MINARLLILYSAMRLHLKLTFCIALGCSLCSSYAYAGKLYKWVDAQGRISYQDKPPPENVEVLSESEITQIADTQTTATAQSSPIEVYTIDNCQSCELLLFRLKQLGLSTQEHSLLNREIQDQILSQNKTLAAPMMRFGSEFVNVTTDEELIEKLTASGYLDASGNSPANIDQNTSDAGQQDNATNY